MLYPLVALVFFNLIIHGSCQLLKLIKLRLDVVKHLPHLQHLPTQCFDSIHPGYFVQVRAILLA